MPTLIITREFIAVEQKAGVYVPHIFRDEEHFWAWCQVHRPRGMVERTYARGLCRQAIDHRHEIDPAVDAILDAVQDEGDAGISRTLAGA